jgi:hypothetical protein
MSAGACLSLSRTGFLALRLCPSSSLNAHMSAAGMPCTLANRISVLTPNLETQVKQQCTLKQTANAQESPCNHHHFCNESLCAMEMWSETEWAHRRSSLYAPRHRACGTGTKFATPISPEHLSCLFLYLQHVWEILTKGMMLHCE